LKIRDRRHRTNKRYYRHARALQWFSAAEQGSREFTRSLCASSLIQNGCFFIGL
jgi:hypothetical protein